MSGEEEAKEVAVEEDPRLERWREQIREWRESGERKRRYCEEKGIKYDQFQYWYRKLGTGAKRRAVRFVQVPAAVIQRGVPMHGVPGSGDGKISVEYREYKVEVRRGFEAEDLLMVMRVLQRV
jgi:hypothetical protein